MVERLGGVRRWLAATLAVSLGAGGLLLAPVTAQAADGPAPNEQRTGVSADALPTVQLDSGMVWSQDLIGSTVYVGGTFSNVRPPNTDAGTNLTPRSNLLAYDIRTGDLVTGFAPSVNGTVKVVKASPDGSRIYVGGTFNTANSTTRYNLAAFDAKTGALITSFNAPVGGSYVNALAVTDGTVYVGGLISAANGLPRKNLMAFSTATGKPLAWAPTTDLQVDAMVLAPNTSKLIVGGRFSQVNGVGQRGLAALDRTTGDLVPWSAPSTVINGDASGKAGIWSLTTDGTAVYGTGWVYASKAVGNLEGVFSAVPDSGDLRWVADCHGDHYGAYSDGTTVYTTSHEHACETMGGYPQKDPAPGNMHNATAVTAAAKGTLLRSQNVNDIYADWSGYPAPAAINWYPDWYTGTSSSLGQAGFSIVGNGDYIAVGGEFIGLNNKLQNGLTRFAKVPATGAKQGPRLTGDNGWTPNVSSVRAGEARVSILTNYDRDDLNLTYEIYRVGRTAPIYTVTQKSLFWNQTTLSFVDTGLALGASVSYRVKAIDGSGNSSTSKTVAVTTSSTQLSAYGNSVIDDGASLYYRLGGGGTSVPDLVGANGGVAGTGVTATGGAVVGDSDPGSAFAGNDSGLVSTSAKVTDLATFSAEAWFKTATTSGGKILGYGAAQTGTSSNYDRHVYMTNDGRIVFGTYPGYTATIASTNPYNDNTWHHVVAIQATDGMKLYIDGELVGTNPAAAAEGYSGYWRVGGDNLNGWPDQPASQWFNGSIDEFALYPSALSAGVVKKHHDFGVGALPPTAAFTSTARDQTVDFDGSTSTASAGRTVASYSWNFGDSSDPGTGVAPSHVYDKPGTYNVTLTVTDSTGSIGTATKTVAAKAPHAPPVAVVKKTTSGLTASFDGTTSTTSDGASLSKYQWSFGDAMTSTDAKPSHPYAKAGSYDVTLVVTDSIGAASAPAAVTVTVTHDNPVAAFTATSDARRVIVDGSASTAADGATLSYAWTWGDQGADGSGKSTDHLYAADGTYPVTLTVTDGLGASATTTRSVSVAAVPLVAKDGFDRTVATGWGAADVGGTWVGSSGQSVSSGVGKLSINKSDTRTTSLPVSKSSIDSRFDVSTNKVADGGGMHLNYIVHRSSAGEYRVKLRYAANGSVNVGLAKVVGTTETLLTNKALTGYTQTADGALTVRLQTSQDGDSTILRAKVWAKGESEPSAWFVSTTASDASLQGAGQIGFSAYGTGTITNGPVTVAIDNLEVR